MARGAVSKQEVTKKILSNFEGSFTYNDGKEIRIPMMEDGELIQIKVALTAAKENVNPGDDNALPGQNNVVQTETGPVFVHTVSKEETKIVEPTEEEKQNVQDLLKSLGL